MKGSLVHCQLMDITAPRRIGKTHVLRLIGTAKQAEDYRVVCYAPSIRSRQELGFPIMDLSLERVTEKHVLLLDDYDLCDESAAIMTSAVLEAGGMVIRTSSPKEN